MILYYVIILCYYVIIYVIILSCFALQSKLKPCRNRVRGYELFYFTINEVSKYSPRRDRVRESVISFLASVCPCFLESTFID